jgi:choline dehydrogenase-like flavoprotein
VAVAATHLPKRRYEAVVVGSGFGGAVAACRLAQAGVDVAIIERGRRFPPGSGDGSGAATRSSASSPSVELTKTRRRWSGVWIPGVSWDAAPERSCGSTIAQVWNVPLGPARSRAAQRLRSSAVVPVEVAAHHGEHLGGGIAADQRVEVRVAG